MALLRKYVFLAVLALAAQERPQVFRITPVRPVAELRAEALAARPPQEQGDFLRSDLVDLTTLDPKIKLDIRYATADNFLSTPVYTSARAFMQRPAAEALLRAHRDLMKQGYGLLIFDAYRPWYVTKIFWDATPPDKHQFVANPAEGSRHNRGCAVDLSLYTLATGREVPMTGVYDEMSERSYPNYAGGTPEQRAHRVAALRLPRLAKLRHPEHYVRGDPVTLISHGRVCLPASASRDCAGSLLHRTDI